VGKKDLAPGALTDGQKGARADVRSDRAEQGAAADQPREGSLCALQRLSPREPAAELGRSAAEGGGIDIMSDPVKGFVIFGPDYREMASGLVARLARENVGGCVVCDERVEALRRSMSRTLPGDRMSPCVLVFAHYIPPTRGRSVSEAQIRKWVSRFGSSIERALTRSGSPGVNWDADKASGAVTLMANWPRTDADTCLELARAIEVAFDSCRGSFGRGDESTRRSLWSRLKAWFSGK
jgi:hypothetical protein